MGRKLVILAGLVLLLGLFTQCNGTWAFYVNGYKVYPRDEPGVDTRVLGPNELWRDRSVQWSNLQQPGNWPW